MKKTILDGFDIREVRDDAVAGLRGGREADLRPRLLSATVVIVGEVA
jgi:hypothetical protein